MAPYAGDPLDLDNALGRDAAPLVESLTGNPEIAGQFRHSAHLFSGMEKDGGLSGFAHVALYSTAVENLSSVACVAASAGLS
jgi:hypothetical protein